jgi:hypothetical protein
MISTILLCLAAALLGFAVYVHRRPSRFEVSRSTVLAVPPSVVFAEVHDLHRFQMWSPWAEMDPSAKVEFSGPPAGPGAEMRWQGNGKVGTGAMILTDSREAERIDFRLEFLRPFKAVNNAHFDFTPVPDGTRVTWRMWGEANFLMKLMGVFMNCDEMCGSQFEWGFRNLRQHLANQSSTMGVSAPPGSVS